MGNARRRELLPSSVCELEPFDHEALEIGWIRGGKHRAGVHSSSGDHAVRQRSASSSRSVEEMCRQNSRFLFEGSYMADQTPDEREVGLLEWATGQFRPAHRTHRQGCTCLDPGSKRAVFGCPWDERPNEKTGIDVNQRQVASLRTEAARRSLRFRATHVSAATPPILADPWSASRASRARASPPAASRTARRNASDLDTPCRLARSAIALTVAGSSAYVDFIVIVAIRLWDGHTSCLSTIPDTIPDIMRHAFVRGAETFRACRLREMHTRWAARILAGTAYSP